MLESTARRGSSSQEPDLPYGWRRAQFSIAGLEIGSLELLIAAGAATAWKGRPALLSFLEGLRDWGAHKRAAKAVADQEESKARILRMEGESAERGARRRGRADQEFIEVEAIADRASAELEKLGVGDERLIPSRNPRLRRQQVSAAVFLAGRIEAVGDD
jgi:hypothetical protein